MSLEILEQIKEKFEEINSLYEELPHELQSKITEFHNSEGSLPHCIRWGNQASEEICHSYSLTGENLSEDF